MTRVWLSGIGISVAAHLAVAAVLFLALDLQPARQQPEPGTRLNVSAIGVPHRRALPRPLPAVALPAMTATGAGGALTAPAAPPTPVRAAIGLAGAARMPGGVPLPVRARPGLPVATGTPDATGVAARASRGETRRAALPRSPSQVAAAPRRPALGANAMPERRGVAAARPGLFRSARPVPALAALERSLTATRLAARPEAQVPAARSPLPVAVTGAEALGSRALRARPPRGRSEGGRRSDDDGLRIAMVPAPVTSDARPLLPVALPGRIPAGRRGDAVAPDGAALRPSPLTPLRVTPPAGPATRAPVLPARLPSLAARSGAAPVTALPDRGLPVRAAPRLPQPAQRGVAAVPVVPGRPAESLRSDGARPDPVSLTAQRALTGGSGTAALVARAQIERALAGQPCSRVQARFDPAGPLLTLHGHVPDLRAAGALMAALRGPLGQDVPVSAKLATLPRPLCDHVARIAALGLRPVDSDLPAGALGPAVQFATLPAVRAAGTGLRLTDDEQGFVHVDLFDASGNVTHLRPPPGSLPARRAPGDTVPLDLPGGAAGQGAEMLAVLVTSRPLYLRPRAGQERATNYLRFLGNQVEATRQAGGMTGSWGYAILPSVPDAR